MVKRSFRNMVDITPWCHRGSSFWGLKRNQAKILALVFLVIGLILVNPPFIPSPDDVLNFFLAGYIVSWFPSISYETSLLITFTLIPWSLILIGLYIYPYNTAIMFNSYLKKAKLFIKKQFSSPTRILITGIVFWVMYNIYKTYFFKGVM